MKRSTEIVLRHLGLALGIGLLSATATAQTPTLSDVAYGSHERQTLDFYRAPSTQPTAVAFFVHGGGWMNGDKAKPDFLPVLLASGVSVVSINYRLIPDAVAEGVSPPVKACLDDAVRALQFVRSKAAEWKIDKRRIGGYGGSAGGFTVLYLAFHPDMAAPASADLVARESTRLSCALGFVPQTTLDPAQMREWIPNNNYGHHAFGLPDFDTFLTRRDALMPWIKEFSPYYLASSDDPPVLLFYDKPPAMGLPASDPPHSANFGAGIARRLAAEGIKHELNYNNDYGNMQYPDIVGFLCAHLNSKNALGDESPTPIGRPE